MASPIVWTRGWEKAGQSATQKMEVRLPMINIFISLYNGLMGDDGAGRLEKNRHLFQCVGVIFVMKLCERARLIKSVFFR